MDETKALRLKHHQSQYLKFRLAESIYAVPVETVSDIVMLPELIPIDERAPHVIGVVDLRGQIVPVVDLQQRFGRVGESYSINDYLLVLEHANQQLALIVNETLGVRKPQPTAFVDATSDRQDACVRRIVTMDDMIVKVLDLDNVVASMSEVVSKPPALSRQSCIAIESAADRAELRRRADHLQQSVTETNSDLLIPYAVAEINGELFGFDLRHVSEFCEAQRIARVPCCPEHIVGNINLNGDVLTVIDIRRALNLIPSKPQTSNKIVVAKTEELTVGVLVDELHGVVDELTLLRADEAERPTSLVAGTAKFGDGMMCLLHLPEVLKLERWVVDDEVSYV